MSTCSQMKRRMLSVHYGSGRLQPLVVLTVVLMISLCVTAECSAQDAKKKSPATTKTLVTKDGWPIRITYYESQQGKNASVVVLLHSKGGNQLVWQNGFAKALQNQGHAVITVDLRKHGKSKLPKAGGVGNDKKKGKKGKKTKKTGGDLNRSDYQRMVTQDLERVKKFIYTEHQKQNLNMRKLAIVAAEMSTPIAVNYALVDWLKKPYDDSSNPLFRTPRGQDVRALVLLSPEPSCPGVSTAKPIKALKNLNVAFLLCVGTNDKLHKRRAETLFKQLGGENQPAKKKRIYLKQYDVKLRGTDLIGKKIGTEPFIFAFLDQHLKQRQIAWRNRKSKL